MSATPKQRLTQTFKREFWRPEDPRVLVRKQPMFGWGWAINFAAVVARIKRRSG